MGTVRPLPRSGEHYVDVDRKKESGWKIGTGEGRSALWKSSSFRNIGVETWCSDDDDPGRGGIGQNFGQLFRANEMHFVAR